MDITLIGFLGNYAGLAGLGYFIYYRDKGLRERINALTQLAKEQKETIEAARERATEFDEMRKKYKEALTDLRRWEEN